MSHKCVFHHFQNAFHPLLLTQTMRTECGNDESYGDVPLTMICHVYCGDTCSYLACSHRQNEKKAEWSSRDGEHWGWQVSIHAKLSDCYKLWTNLLPVGFWRSGFSLCGRLGQAQTVGIMLAAHLLEVEYTIQSVECVAMLFSVQLHTKTQRSQKWKKHQNEWRQSHIFYCLQML